MKPSLRTRTTVLLLTEVILMIAVTAVSCADKKSGRTLTVSVEPQRALLEAIVGDRYEVETLLPSGANPETFDPTLKARRSVDDSQAFFSTGNMPFEEKLAANLSENVTVVNTSSGIHPIYGTHDHHHHGNHGYNGEDASRHDNHGTPDPHTWVSVKNARIMAKNMYEAVVKLDPDGKDYYMTRYNALSSTLDSVDRAFTIALSHVPVKSFAVWHPSLSYFARDYGLEQISVGFENKEISPARMAQTVRDAQAHGVRVLFFQEEFDSRQVETLNMTLQAKLITINPLSYDWIGQLQRVVDALQ